MANPDRFCKHCGNQIPPARVEAIPNVSQCVPCKEQFGDEPAKVGYMVYSPEFHTDPSSGTLHFTTQDVLDAEGDEKFSRRRKKTE